MIYITGDTHGAFQSVEEFCGRFETEPNDILIILGDAGINYRHDETTQLLKTYLEALPITLFCIHGNHEQRPGNFDTYEETVWRGGIVYQEKEFPSLLFAKDGELFDLDGAKTIAIGGAYSVDKPMRLARGYGWWEDEQPSAEVKAYVERQLAGAGWAVDVVLSHTVPLKYEPRETFLSGIEQSTVDKSTEIWLDGIEEKLSYNKWYCGHYHTDKVIDKVELMFNGIKAFYGQGFLFGETL